MAYTAAELQSEQGIGPARVLEIETWLKAQGLTFRASTELSADDDRHNMGKPGGGIRKRR